MSEVNKKKIPYKFMIDQTHLKLYHVYSCPLQKSESLFFLNSKNQDN